MIARVKRKIQRVKRKQVGEIEWRELTPPNWIGHGQLAIYRIELDTDAVFSLRTEAGRILYRSTRADNCKWAAEEGERRKILGPVEPLPMAALIQKFR